MGRIKDTARVDRPREKLISKGAGHLSNSELLAILLRTGTKKKSAVELAKYILQRFRKSSFAEADVEQLSKISGLGKAKAAEIVASFELSKRFLKEKKAKLYLTPKDVWRELKDIRDNKKEHFVVFFLDTRNQEIKREVTSVGTLDTNLVHPREVFEPAIRYSAAQVMVAHNHPSGDVTPSSEDIEITNRLKEAGKILGIDLMDHVVITKEEFKSMKEEGIF